MNTEELPKTQLEAIRYFADADNCHTFLTAMRWGMQVRCAHCESERIGKLVVSGKRRLWNCKVCKKQFTAKVGTIFEDSPLGLDKWLPAVWMIVNAKNGVSSCELARSLGVTQKTAWHMGHRIRLAMQQGNFQVAGEVEADETFIGGVAGNLSKAERASRHAEEIETGKYPKVPVHGVLERSAEKGKSRVALTVLPSTRKEPIVGAVHARVRPGSKVFTDSLRSYRHIGPAYDHEFIDHTITYARGKVHTNGLENFWSLLKRTLGGTYVQVSPEHLFRYLDEQSTRFNERSTDDCTRFLSSMNRVSGRRLTWNALTAKQPA